MDRGQARLVRCQARHYLTLAQRLGQSAPCAQDLRDSGQDDDALKTVKDFNHTFCASRVLDPRSATGNFLYMSLELMKPVEGEALKTLDDVGLQNPTFEYKGETVTRRQFFGLDLNAPDTAIDDLVLWLGYINWRPETSGVKSISDPVLEKLGNIKHQDAIMAYDGKALAMEETDKPIRKF